MTRLLTILVTLLTGAVLGVVGACLPRASTPVCMGLDDSGAVPVHGVVTVTQPEIGHYALRFEGQTKASDKNPPRSVRVALRAELGKLRGNFDASEFQFGDVRGFVQTDVEEPK